MNLTNLPKGYSVRIEEPGASETCCVSVSLYKGSMARCTNLVYKSEVDREVERLLKDELWLSKFKIGTTMTRKQFAKNTQETAIRMLEQGWSVEIQGGDWHRITVHGPGEIHWIDGNEARELVEDLPSFLDAEDYILWLTSGWRLGVDPMVDLWAAARCWPCG